MKARGLSGCAINYSPGETSRDNQLQNTGGFYISLSPSVDSRDVRFVLFEMLGFDKINRFEHFACLDKEVFEDTLSLAEKIAMAQFYTPYKE